MLYVISKKKSCNNKQFQSADKLTYLNKFKIDNGLDQSWAHLTAVATIARRFMAKETVDQLPHAQL